MGGQGKMGRGGGGGRSKTGGIIHFKVILVPQKMLEKTLNF